MGIFGQLGKMLKLNKDPSQQQLARLFILAGSSTPKDAVPVAAVIEQFVADHGWTGNEATERLAHALSLVKVQAPGIVYENATEVWRSVVGLDRPSTEPEHEPTPPIPPHIPSPSDKRSAAGLLWFGAVGALIGVLVIGWKIVASTQ
jgi:hypothetical protein